MPSEQLEIERLLSEIADEGATPERVGRLQEILLDRPELQDYYARVVALHTLLKFELDLSAQQFAPVIDARPSAGRANGATLSGPHRSQRSLWANIVIALAASLMVIATVGYWLVQPTGSRQSSPLTAAQEPVAAKGEILAILRNVTRTAVAEVTLPARAALDSGLTLCSGAVWITRSPGQLERGYMVEVPPGAAINVAVDAAAGAQNALAVVELDARGGPTGNVMFFGNDKSLIEEQVPVGGDPIANWSQRNDTLAPKYYLFTSIHKPQRSKDDRWRLSDYEVLLDSAHVTYLGWDDSGYTVAANPTSEDYYVDKDYNDISAIIQIRRAAAAAELNVPILYAPQPLLEEAAEPVDSDAESVFTVRPGQSALISISRISGRDDWQNEVEIVARKSQEVVWRHHRTPNAPKRPHTYLIRNNSSEVQEYYLKGRHKGWGEVAEAEPWVFSPCKVLRDESPSLVLGLEDRGDDNFNDYDDVIVHIRHLSNASQLYNDQLL